MLWVASRCRPRTVVSVDQRAQERCGGRWLGVRFSALQGTQPAAAERRLHFTAVARRRARALSSACASQARAWADVSCSRAPSAFRWMDCTPRRIMSREVSRAAEALGQFVSPNEMRAFKERPPPAVPSPHTHTYGTAGGAAAAAACASSCNSLGWCQHQQTGLCWVRALGGVP